MRRLLLVRPFLLVFFLSLGLGLGLGGCGDDGSPAVVPGDAAAGPDLVRDVGAGEIVFCAWTCERMECGVDGCGSSCGVCAEGLECLNGACVAACTPDCAGRACGTDGCGGTCGTCGAAEACREGVCEAPCAPTCAPAAECGDNGCGGVCGVCPAGEQCFGDQCLTDCTPNCAGRECGADGCGGTCGTCGGAESCVDGLCRDCSCGARVCGDNGCGGSCGTCPAGEFCVQGACQATCTPDCAGRVCGDDGCGGTCGSCPAGQACVAGACSTTCSPDCTGRVCGPDGCGGTCGSCGAGEACTAGACGPVCTPDCAGKQCGPNGCGGSCGSCPAGDACIAGACVSCQPSCGGRQCGDDGCGGRCGTCGANEACTNGACVPLCVPSCAGRVCGDNGCGGSCGSCGAGAVCTDGVCAQPTQLVDWCRFQWPRQATVEVGATLTVYGRVFEAGITDATPGPDPDARLVVAAGVGPVGGQPGSGVFTWVAAQPNPAWNDAQEPGNDEYLALVIAPAAPGEYDLAFRATVDGGAHWLYCDLQTPAGDGSADGWQSANAARLQAVCAPNCGPRVCGPDGCGGVCGTCGAGETCQEGACVGASDPADWCRLQWPLAYLAAPGETFTAYVRVYEAGLTSRSDAVDVDPALVVAGGIGPDGSQPTDATWATWTAAVPNPAWSAAAAGEPNNDEYMVTLTAPAAPGSYDYAFRASADGGSSWIYCDVNAGFGRDGSEDGYQPDNAGALTVGCVPACGGRVCGDDGCGGSCGACGDDERCADGVCVSDCTPACGGRECGDDGCGGLCGTCGPDEACAAGVCVGCTPDCDGRECGDDGCDGTCGPCAAGESCQDGQCVAQPAFGWCRLQWVSATVAAPGDPLTAYVRVYVAGITDRTSGTDTSARLAVAVGVGPDDASPADGAFTWTDAEANISWTDTPEVGNDEYQAIFAAPAAAGAYDIAGRVTFDGTRTLYCDTNAGFQRDGSEDGYQPETAWLLTVP